MAIRINNKELLVGIQHTIASHGIKKIRVNGTQVWQYDNTPPTLVLTSPGAGDVISASARKFTIQGNVSDNDSGLASLTINDNSVIVTNGEFSFTTGNGTQDYVINVRDNAGNVRTKTVHIVRNNYNNVRKWKSGDEPGNETYWEHCSCQVCGKGGSAHKWRGNGNNVYDDPDTLFSNCPNGPHYKYTISIT